MLPMPTASTKEVQKTWVYPSMCSKETGDGVDSMTFRSYNIRGTFTSQFEQGILPLTAYIYSSNCVVVKRTAKVPWPILCVKLSLWHAETTSGVQVNYFFPGNEIGDSILQTRKKMENGETKKKKKAEFTCSV
jgi:hypothetical protein